MTSFVSKCFSLLRSSHIIIQSLFPLIFKALIAKDPGGCPDREQQLVETIKTLESNITHLTKQNQSLTQERDQLNVEIRNLRAPETFEPTNGDGDLVLPPGVTADAARKRLFRLCKPNCDG